jgi:hypothetical protein
MGMLLVAIPAFALAQCVKRLAKKNRVNKFFIS